MKHAGDPTVSHPTNRSRLAAHPTVVELRIRPPERSADIGLPLLRGRLHQAAFVLAVPAGLALVLTVNGISARIAALVYSVTLAGLFASSALYNRRLGTPLLRPWMKWADHAMSYLLIAGSYTPMCVVSLPRRWGIPLLAVIWTAALAGAGLKFVWRYRFRVAGGVLYVALGWAAFAALPQLVEHLSGTSISLLLGGGALYMAGAIVLARRRPDPSPTWFGYHEVWHAFVVLAGGCHYAAIWLALH